MTKSSESETFIIEEEARPQLLDSMTHLYSAAKFALFDLLDNELDAATPGEPTMVNVNCARDRLDFSGLGGEGMDKEGLKNFFAWGTSRKRAKLGRYGHGAKTAMSYLARSFKITCAKEQGDVLELAGRLEGRETGFLKHEGRMSGGNRGRAFVKISLSGLKRTVQPRSLAEDIGNYYDPALEKERILVYVNDQRVEPIKVVEPGERVEPEKVRNTVYLAEKKAWFEFGLPDGSKVTGWYGKLDKDKPPPQLVKPGIRVYVYDRRVSHGLTFGHPSVDSDPGMRLLFGKLFIDSEHVAVTSAKENLDFDNDLWKEVIEPKMHEILKPFVDRISELPEAERVPRGDKEAIDKGIRAVKLALTSLGESFGLGTGRRIKVRGGDKFSSGQSGKRQESGDQEARQKARKAVWKVSRPEERQRHFAGGFPEIKLRDLGLRVRSEMVETVDEKGGKKISLFVNRNFSAYSSYRKRDSLPVYIVDVLSYELARIATVGHRAEEDYDRILKYTFEEIQDEAHRIGSKQGIL